MSPSPSPSAVAPGAAAGTGTDMFGYLMPLMFLLAGLYMIWRAIVPGGKTFDFPQYKTDIRPHMVKTMRLFFAIEGPLCLVQAVFSYLADTMGNTAYYWWNVISLIVAFVGIVLYVVFFIVKYRKFRIM